MNSILLILLSLTAILCVYWLILGQWKYNKIMRPQKKLKAILFDLDGVIIDSFNAWFKIFNKTRKHYKLTEVSEQEFEKKIWGTCFENSTKKYFKGIELEEITKFYFSRIEEFKSNTKLNENVKETLEKIKQKGIKTAIVSNTNQKSVSEILKHHKLSRFFDTILGGDSVEHGKPAPDSLLEACKQLGVKTSESIMVGDTFNDKGAAKNANVFFIGYNIDGDFKISDFKDLLGLF